MQQFARRQPSDDENAPPRQFVASDEATAQLLDQVTELSKQVLTLREEVGTVKGENQRLRAQMTEWIAEQERRNFGGTRPTEAPPVNELSQTNVPPIDSSQEENLNEETVIEQARDMGQTEEKEISPTAPIMPEPVAKQEEPPKKAEEPKADKPLTDDEIQKLLADAALGAIDTAKATDTVEPAPEPVAKEVLTEQPKAVATEPEPKPALRIEEADALAFEDIEFDSAAVAKVPSHLAIGALAVPVKIEDGTLLCKAVAPFDYASLDMIADATACKVSAEPAQIEQVLAALRKAYKEEHEEYERETVWEAAPARKKKRRGLFRKAA